MLARVLIILGSLCLIATNWMAWWFVNFACGMNTTGCRTGGPTLFWRFITSGESGVYWLALILGLSLLVSGLNLRHVDKRPPAP